MSGQCITFVGDCNDGGDINDPSLLGVSLVALAAICIKGVRLPLLV